MPLSRTRVGTLFTQIAPLVVAFSDAPAMIRVATAIEIGLATAWTGYLVTSD